MGRGSRLLAVVTAAVALLATLLGAPSRADDSKWMTGWATAHVYQDNRQTFTMGAFPLQTVRKQTIRQIVETELEGSALKIRLSNFQGGQPVHFGHATVAISAAGPALEPGTVRHLTFEGESSLVIPPGQVRVSDEVDLPVQRGDHLAISLYVVEANGPYSGHSEAKNVGYYSPPLTGDLTDDLVSPALSIPTPAWTWIQAVEVLSTPRPVIVVLGDSVSDGFISPEVRQEWPGRLAERLGDQAAVINNAIDASIATPTACALCGPSLLTRLQHDAISLPGVTHVIVFVGVNDVTQLVPPARITDAYAEAARRLHARGIEMILATLTPRYDVALGWDPDVHGPNRHRVNNWIRTNEALFDGIVDFDAALRWDADPDRMFPPYDSGDNSHPNVLGMQVLAETVDLRLLDISTGSSTAPKGDN